jgi:hypothetical protein
MEQKSYHMTKQPEHCYLCEHRAEIEQGDFYCGLDEKNHCLLGADFPTDCPLQKGGQMKPTNAYLIMQGDEPYLSNEDVSCGVRDNLEPDEEDCMWYWTCANEDDAKRACEIINGSSFKPVLICSDPGLTEEEKEELKIMVLTGSSINPKLFDSAIYKLAIMVGMIEFKEAK